DEIRLRIIHRKRLLNCKVMIFTETWLNSGIPDNAIELAGRDTLRADRTADESGKTRGGGLCIYVNKAWCTNSVIVGIHCSANLEFLMTKELIVDFRKERGGTHDPIHINGMAVERVPSFKFLGTHISEDLSWTTNTSSLVKKAHQRLFFLRTLKKNQLSSAILVNFYRCAVESILTNCVTAWYGSCSVAERKALQRVVKTAQRITGTPLSAIEDIQRKRCLRRARGILKDSSHPAHRLFSLLPSGRRLRCLRTRTSRLRNSFFPRPSIYNGHSTFPLVNSS
ncbi:hypothetical protein IRJ41_021014, partial [Triplophysa rosa]